MRISLRSGNEVRIAQAQLLLIDVLPASPAAKEDLVDFLNAHRPGTTFELFRLEATTARDFAGGQLLILATELPAWERSARDHGVRLVVTAERPQLGEWDGGAILTTDPLDSDCLLVRLTD
jgi:hypothetical protein